ncbi:LysR family transcriptional regulator substrate-binding protein [Bradyrhizobium sp. LM2.9]
MAAFDKLTATDLKDKFLILFEPRTPHGSIAEKQFREIGIEPHVGIRVRHIETAIGLVHEGVGIAIVDDVAVVGETGRRFSTIDIDGSPALSVHLSWNREQSQSQMFRHFRRLLHLPAQ